MLLDLFNGMPNQLCDMVVGHVLASSVSNLPRKRDVLLDMLGNIYPASDISIIVFAYLVLSVCTLSQGFLQKSGEQVDKKIKDILSEMDDILTEENSIRIDPDSVDQIRDAIEQLRKDGEKRTRMGEASLRLSGELTIDNRARNILNFMDSLIQK